MILLDTSNMENEIKGNQSLIRSSTPVSKKIVSSLTENKRRLFLYLDQAYLPIILVGVLIELSY